MKKYLLTTIFLVFILVLLVLPVYAQGHNTNLKAKVIKTNNIEEIKEKDAPIRKVQNVTVRILEGEYENEEYEMQYVVSENLEDITSNVELKEDNNILVQIEEKNGEIIKINYIKTIDSNYILYILGAILLILLIIIGINTGMMQIIIYLVTLTLVSCTLIFSMKMGWNLILVSSILSFVITVSYIIRANGINIKTLVMIISSIISISFAGVLINIIFNVTGLANINVKITENFVNIKDFVCSSIIVVSCGLCNLIILIKLNIESFFNKTYKTKSDNIIEGQRSLKL